MTTGAIFNSGVRFVLLLVIQAFVLQQVRWGFGGVDYLYVFIYPLFVAFLPLFMPRSLVIFLGFLLGLGIDLFYETLGLHAAALTFTAWVRPLVLRLVEPRDGYNIKDGPVAADQGAVWMARYLALLFLLHCISFFTIQAFSFVFLKDILLKVLFTFPVSYLLAGILVIIFNPRE